MPIINMCRMCKCTEINACFTITAEVEPLGYGKFVLRGISNSVACHWVERDLCSVCVEAAKKADKQKARAKRDKADTRVISKVDLRSIGLVHSAPGGGKITSASRALLQTIEPTKQICPLGSGNTHHLVPKGEVLTCQYCSKSDSWLKGER